MLCSNIFTVFPDVVYDFIREAGKGGSKDFMVKVIVDGLTYFGIGTSKIFAKQAAAKVALVEKFKILSVPGELPPDVGQFFTESFKDLQDTCRSIYMLSGLHIL